MKKKIIQWNQSNIQVDISLDNDSYKKIEEKTLTEFWKDMDVPWYRKWKAPIEEILKKVNPQYLETAIYEFAVNDALQEVNKEYQLIGQIYDVNPSQEWDKRWISFKVDVYPEVEVKNDKHNSVKPYLPNPKVAEDEKQAAIDWLQKQFAEYENIETVDVDDSFVKLELKYLDDSWKEISDWKVFLSKEDYAEFPELSEAFKWKKLWFKANFDYTDKLPQLLKYFKKDAGDLKINSVEAEIVEIKKAKLPELSLENLKKWFGKTYKDMWEFDQEIESALVVEKERAEMLKFIEDLVSKISPSFSVNIPKTLIDQETKQRLEHLKGQYGGEQNFEKMLKSMKPEEVKKMYEEITSASKISVEKFFILMKFADLNNLSDKIDFQKDLDLEKNLLSIFTDNDKEKKSNKDKKTTSTKKPKKK